ncbi:BTAD domain-containing putative transcriptional regulator [Rhodococcus maanshanensis]|uniref:Predicted ATPase n=1 Tax=Rhodococcus maanshanensis TaxID=183556 RepID=A0A1H7JKN9_9NOCA|nr:BTAD domain-containing putative transcriptional regulator [Rhodococcus maanshanensis]SEK74427.1 Predicted ATPase [Rhodococcus maanshanensis]
MPLPGARARSLLVALAGRPGRSRSAQSLIEDVWGETPPRSPINALHTQISRLRGALPEGAIEIGPAGYRLDLTRAQVDLTLARMWEQQAQQLMAEGDPRGAIDTIRRARALWRGEPGADLPAGDLARELVEEGHARLAALDVVEVVALVGVGELGEALPLAEQMAARAPLDERAHEQLMVVLYGLGRANDALEVFAGLRARLADRLGTDPSPRLVRLNAAVLNGDLPVRAASGEAPEPTRPAPRPALMAVGLRAAPNALLGREADLDAIEDLLATSRVVTVLGPGGTGKTRVAHALGSRAAERVPVALVELASLRSGEDVVAAISGTLGLSEAELTPGTALTRARRYDARDRLREALSARPTLLILDNCEHLIDDVAEVVADLVAASANLTVLATSRAPMAITAEAVYPLPPLVIDESGSPATDLFRTRALAVRPAALLDPVEVARLCRTLDGLPLAIELAAARVRTMSVAEINARLDDRFALLRSGDRTSPERHRTLRAVIEWSWNLLEQDQQAALRRLCRFPAGFTLAAAVEVAQWGEVTDIADALDGLVNQSMLSVVEGADSSGLRYHMLETVREFGEGQLARENESGEVAARTVAWARTFCLDAVRDFLDGHQVVTALRIEAEHDNLLAVLRHTLSVGDGVGALTVFPVLGVTWSFRGAHSEVIGFAPRVLEIDPRRHGPDLLSGNCLALTYLVIVGHTAFGGVGRALAVTRLRLRWVLASRTDIDAVVRMNASLVVMPATGKGLARKLARAIRSEDPGARSSAYMARANLRENSGDLYGSWADATAARELAEAGGDVWGMAMVLQHLGSLAGQSARYGEAVGHYRRAAELLWDLHAYEESTTLRSYIGAALVGAGRVEEARREMVAGGSAVEQLELSAAGDRSTFGLGDARQSAGAIAAAMAEVDLAEGSVDAGLRGYRHALELVGWQNAGQNPDPFGFMLLAAAVAAHALAGRGEEIADLVDTYAGLVMTHLGPDGYPDLPQTGGVACAVGSFDIATGRNPEGGLRMIALSTRVAARQDLPSMQRTRHLAAARKALGADRVDAELARVERMPRRVARDEILAALRER